MPTAWRRSAPRRHPLGDAAVAVALFAVTVAGSRVQGPHTTDTRVWLPVAVALAGGACAVLPLRRRHPWAVAAVASAATLALAALGALLTPMVLAPLLAALFWLTSAARARRAVVFAGAVAALLTAAATAAGPPERPWFLETITPLSWLVMSVILGAWARSRRAYLLAERARAELAERTREQEARVRVAAERARIARELHDAVAHHLALANAQAGTAAHLMRTQPEQAQVILTELNRSTSAALRDLKAAVGVLRQPDDPDAPLEPAPGLARLDELTSSCASAGLAVTVSTEGSPRPLSSSVDLAAYRVVQEALTNVTKHAATPSAHVRLAYAPGGLTITVTDGPGLPAHQRQSRTSGAVASGTFASTSGATAAFATAKAATGPALAADGATGFGLVGLRERARSVGGRLVAGHRPHGGFQVMAELPLPPADEPEPAR
ncbi:sensor histidine kinase [Frankia sp. CN7]|uniref:histidine kinase n=1 Tax=Frankia nepalensis TaxID=1836974 RepID=A0A937RIX1_9ACTN|nr:histidine kinase [Frankia nepalensis]MBL7495839.1 sensor histidine kinase [Frankia nepalensis]MBL7629674.1 sensor histidine kinase [Frankia nepalensis]